jgi:galactitol-specific phosphotransferase system IIB component
MTVYLSCNVEAWIKNFVIEAPSEEEAIKKLVSMSLAELIEKGADIDSTMKFTEIDTEVSDYDLVVSVTNIEYDLDPEIMDAAVINYLKGLLPKEKTITLKNVTDSDDLEDLVRDELYAETNYDTVSFDIKVLEKK